MTCTHLLCRIFYMITFVTAKVTWERWESVLFQPVLKAYPTHNPWIITIHLSLGNLEKQWKIFIKQMERTQQLLNSIQQRPLAPTHLISTLQVELTSLGSIYMSYRPLILAATQLYEEGKFLWWRLSFQQMHKEKPSTFLGRCTMLAHGKSNDKGCQQYQEKSQPTDYSTKHTTRNSCPHHLCFKCHQICHSGEQAIHQHSMDIVEQTCQDTLQLHKFTVQQLELPASHTLHWLVFSKSSRFTVLYEGSCHAYTGLHRCSHNWNSLTSCTTSRRSQEDALTHWGSTTFDHALTSFISFDCRWTTPITHLCTHTGLCTATWNIWNLQFSHTSQKFFSMLQHKQQVFRHNIWWNQNSGDFRRSVQHLPEG